MSNTSLIDVAEELQSSMSELGLHLEGQPAFISHMPEDHNMGDDDDEDGDTRVYTTPEEVVDAVKRGEGHAIIVMHFAVNRLAWTDRVLNPDSHISPEMVEGMGLPSQQGMMQEELDRRLAAGDSIEEIMDDLLGGDEEE